MQQAQQDNLSQNTDFLEEQLNDEYRPSKEQILAQAQNLGFNINDRVALKIAQQSLITKLPQDWRPIKNSRKERYGIKSHPIDMLSIQRYYKHINQRPPRQQRIELDKISQKLQRLLYREQNKQRQIRLQQIRQLTIEQSSSKKSKQQIIDQQSQKIDYKDIRDEIIRQFEQQYNDKINSFKQSLIQNQQQQIDKYYLQTKLKIKLNHPLPLQILSMAQIVKSFNIKLQQFKKQTYQPISISQQQINHRIQKYLLIYLQKGKQLIRKAKSFKIERMNQHIWQYHYKQKQKFYKQQIFKNTYPLIQLFITQSYQSNINQLNSIKYLLRKHINQLNRILDKGKNQSVKKIIASKYQVIKDQKNNISFKVDCPQNVKLAIRQKSKSRSKLNSDKILTQRNKSYSQMLLKRRLAYY